MYEAPHHLSVGLCKVWCRSVDARRL